MMKDKKLYIAYGSNLSTKQMAQRCPGARVVGSGILYGWQLMFRQFATIERNPERNTPVLVWEITPLNERQLDFYEGYPRFYRKQDVELEVFPMDGGESEKRTAMVYIMTDGYGCEPPAIGYYRTMEEDYRTFHFPQHVLWQALVDSIGREAANAYLKGCEQNG